MAVTSMSSMTPGATSCVACDGGGDIVCIDALLFGICDRHCACPQDLVADTSCVGNSIVKHS
jgi:hypothetical protein